MAATNSNTEPIVATGTVKQSEVLTFFNTLTGKNTKISQEHYERLKKENYPLGHLESAREE